MLGKIIVFFSKCLFMFSIVVYQRVNPNIMNLINNSSDYSDNTDMTVTTINSMNLYFKKSYQYNDANTIMPYTYP